VVSEFFLAKEFGWTLDYIRRVDFRDVDILTTLIGIMYKIKASGKDVESQAVSSAMFGSK
jgi:hypothetical protein